MNLAIIDSSVAVKWVVDEKLSEKAILLGNVRTLLAPAHWLVETTEILNAKQRLGELTEGEALQRAQYLSRAPVRSIPQDDIYDRAADLSLRLALTLYDTLYVALALREKAPLVTADKTLYKQCNSDPETASCVLWLGLFDPALPWNSKGASDHA